MRAAIRARTVDLGFPDQPRPGRRGPCFAWPTPYFRTVSSIVGRADASHVKWSRLLSLLVLGAVSAGCAAGVAAPRPSSPSFTQTPATAAPLPTPQIVYVFVTSPPTPEPSPTLLPTPEPTPKPTPKPTPRIVSIYDAGVTELDGDVTAWCDQHDIALKLEAAYNTDDSTPLGQQADVHVLISKRVVDSQGRQGWRVAIDPAQWLHVEVRCGNT